VPSTAVATLVLALVTGAAAADGPLGVRSGALTGTTSLRTGTELVLINASAYDRDGRLVTGIRSEEVRLFDEGVEQQLSAFSLEDAPVSVAIVLDASGSMKSALPHVEAALSHLSAAAKPDDEFLLITVRDEPVEAIPFSPDTSRIESAIRDEQAVGNTAVIDGLVMAFQKVKVGRNARKAILLFSDGRDTNSRYRWSELEHIAREATAPIYAFVIPGMSEEDIEDAFRLQHIAEHTGGRCILLGKSREFPEKMRNLDIHRQYVLGFKPPLIVGASKYRRVRLKFNTPHRGVKLFWRRGYYP